MPDRAAWREWARGERDIDIEGGPDVSFVEPLLRRRLSRVSRMAFRAATDCLEGEPRADMLVFCSRYGEYGRTFDLLGDLCAAKPASAAAFSTSVHNTAASLFAIHRKERGPATVIAGNAATLEAACLHAWTLIAAGAAASVLVVYHDEPLPSLYQGQPTSVRHGMALAFLLEGAEGSEGIRLHLSWRRRPVPVPAEAGADTALGVVKLCLGGTDPVAVEANHLTWYWSGGRAAA